MIAQTVNLLPHTKYDKLVELITFVLNKMAETVDPKLCPCDKNPKSDKCLWPLLHTDLREIAAKSKYRGLTLGNFMANKLSNIPGGEED